MNFLWCTINVTNMEQSIRFYQEVVGLSVNNIFMAGQDVEIAFLGEQPTQIELICNKNVEANINKKEGVTLGFQAKSIEETINFLKQKGYDKIDGPYQPNPHIKFIFINDPNGVRIQFVENI